MAAERFLPANLQICNFAESEVLKGGQDGSCPPLHCAFRESMITPTMYQFLSRRANTERVAQKPYSQVTDAHSQQAMAYAGNSRT